MVALVFAVPAGASAQANVTVEFIAAGDPATLDAMTVRIRALEARFPIVVQFRALPAIDAREIVAPRATGDAAFARVWLDMTSAERAMLFIANASHDRFLVRVVPTSDGYGELTRESLATVVESALDAMLAGGQIGVDRKEAKRVIESEIQTPAAAPEAAPPPVVIADDPEPVETPLGRSISARPLLLALHYRGEAIADGPALRHGLQLALSWSGAEPRADLLVAVTAHYFPPALLGEDRARVRQHGGGGRAAIGAAGNVARMFHWQAAIGGGADLLHSDPVVDVGSALIAEQPFLVARPIATIFASGALRPAEWIELRLGLGLDVDLVGHRFDVQTADERTAVVSPWRAHPYCFAGVGAPLAL